MKTNHLKPLFICFLFLQIGSVLFAQTDPKQLLLQIEKSTTTSQKLKLYNELIETCPEDQLEKHNEAFGLAISQAEKSSKIPEKLLNKYKSSYYNNQGYVFEIKGDIKAALHSYDISLKLAEKYDNLPQVATSYQNLASVYDVQGDYPKALSYYHKSYAIKKKINDRQGMAYSLNNIAYIHTLLKNYDSTQYSYRKSAEIFQSLNDSENYALVLNNIGYVFLDQNQLDSAGYYFMETVRIREKIGDNKGLIYSNINLADLYFTEGKLRKALTYGEKAEELAAQFGSIIEQKNVAFLLYRIYEQLGDYKQAHEQFKQHNLLKDSLINEENKSSIYKQQLKYENDQKMAKLEKEKAVQLAISDEKNQRQLFVIIFGIIGFCIISIFSIILNKRFKLSKQQNIRISEQKSIIEEKQKEIHQSISYAERIQKSFLASETIFEEHVSEHFIYFQPKDVVSGDFYWAGYENSRFYVCAADSTGHGIPGAFMSLLNISLLNEGLLSKSITKTNELLDFVRKILILGLKPDESGQGGKDGMDCVCISIDTTTLELEFTGANNPLWIVRSGELIEVKADKMSVGRSPKEDIPFSINQFQLQKGDLLYLFSDGFADQFGGPKGKKFKYKPMGELFLEISNLDLKSQHQKIQHTFESWKGELEQTDDVCIIGLKI